MVEGEMTCPVCGQNYDNCTHNFDEAIAAARANNDTKRAGAYILKVTDNQIGYGDDPVGFLMASNSELVHRNREIGDALRLLRSLIKEGTIPRYYVVPGAALNTVIEEVVDPVLRAYVSSPWAEDKEDV